MNEFKADWCADLDRFLRVTVWMVVRLVAMCLGLAGAAHAEDNFLPPEAAFKLTARMADTRTVELRYEIARGYYLYRERFAISAQPDSVVLGTPAYPKGKVKYDETFQKDVETYSDAVVLQVPVVAAPAEFKLLATNQGCADQGLCYPPQQRALKVLVANGVLQKIELLGNEAANWIPPAQPANPLRVADGVATVAPVGKLAGVDGSAPSDPSAVLQAGRWWATVGAFLLAGLLLSFTPCVLPMVPILSSVVIGQSAGLRWRALSLSVAYVVGMAVVYTCFGIAAGLAGQGLVAALQNAWVLGAFAAVLVVLALSMFGLYEIQAPARLRDWSVALSSRLPGGHHGGVFLLGGLSAVIASPCVAAPLAASLVYISQTRDVWLGGTALFALSLGMGLPLLLLGLSADALLPRVGPWMESVKRFFGALLLGLALWLVTPLLPAWLAMLCWGGFAMFAAVLLGLFERLPARRSLPARLGKGLGVLLALLGAAQWVGALSGGRDLWQPLAHLRADVALGTSTERTAGPRFTRIASTSDLDAALATAGRPVMLDFYADWCVSCKEMEAWTFNDPQVREQLAQMLLLQVDVTANSAADQALLKRFQLFGPPGIVFFTAGGQEVTTHRLIGFEKAERFLQRLQRVLR